MKKVQMHGMFLNITSLSSVFFKCLLFNTMITMIRGLIFNSGTLGNV